MYDLHIKCPKCMHRMVVGEEDVGHLRTCPKCRCRFEIPNELDSGAVYSSVDAVDSMVVSASEKLERKMAEQAKHRTTVTISVLAWLGLVTCMLVVLTTPLSIFQMTAGFVACFIVAMILLVRRDFVNGVLIVAAAILFYVILWRCYEPPKQKKSDKVLFVAGQPIDYRALEKKNPKSEKEPAEKDLVKREEQAPVVESRPEDETKVMAVPTQDAVLDTGDEIVPMDADELPYDIGVEDIEYVEPEETVAVEVEKPAMPFVLYSDCEGPQPFSPYGWMGNQEAIYQDECWAENPQSGTTCIKVVYDDIGRWGGSAWQAPPNNWGEMAPVYDFSNADRLTFWAKGKHGGERVEFKVGLLARGGSSYHDSVRKGIPRVTLGNTWKKYEIDLHTTDRSAVITAFSWVLEGKKSPVTFYLDNVQFEADPKK